MAAPAARPVGLRARIRSCRCPSRFQLCPPGWRGAAVRYFGLDVHLDFCEVAVKDGGKVSQLGRIASTPEAIREFAAGLSGEDHVALEASSGAMTIARLLREGAAGRV